MIHSKSLLAAVILGLAASVSGAQTPAVANANAPATATDAWTHKTKRLDRGAVDALLARPQKLVVIDVRRPDELTAKGSFPVYLNIQAKQLESALPYIPKDRVILTVSNHAHRAGDAGDLLTNKGFKVAGATGSEDYEAQGGTALVRIPVPAKPASASAAP
jgi:rhodanese-related sulfurtransferase